MSSSVADYNFNELGIITDPGKFESEFLYLPYFWQSSLDGLADTIKNGVFSVEITDDDVKHFEQLLNQERDPLRLQGLTVVVGILKGRKRKVRFTERSDGFVCEC